MDSPRNTTGQADGRSACRQDREISGGQGVECDLPGDGAGACCAVDDQLTRTRQPHGVWRSPDADGGLPRAREGDGGAGWDEARVAHPHTAACWQGDGGKARLQVGERPAGDLEGGLKAVTKPGHFTDCAGGGEEEAARQVAQPQFQPRRGTHSGELVDDLECGGEQADGEGAKAPASRAHQPAFPADDLYLVDHSGCWGKYRWVGDAAAGGQ
ncbi:MAG: hypothetical protein KHX93_00160 [Actinomyces sp. oral taxon 181]|nr:hypothetical protein [Actinomyces sp. oral taxon 181]